MTCTSQRPLVRRKKEKKAGNDRIRKRLKNRNGYKRYLEKKTKGGRKRREPLRMVFGRGKERNTVGLFEGAEGEERGFCFCRHGRIRQAGR